MTSKLFKAHQPRDTASYQAGFQVSLATKRILGSLPDQWGHIACAPSFWSWWGT